MSDKDIDEAYEATGGAPFFHPGKDSPEIEYMLDAGASSSAGSCPSGSSAPSR